MHLVWYNKGADGWEDVSHNKLECQQPLLGSVAFFRACRPQKGLLAVKGLTVTSWEQMACGTEKYHAYLASREWALKKRAVHKRSAGICEACFTRHATETHHDTYIRLYHELLDDLRAVCHQCHLELSGLAEGVLEKVINENQEKIFCISCGEDAKDPIGRNEKGEWLCERCIEIHEALRRREVEFA